MVARILFIAIALVVAAPTGASAAAPVSASWHGPICTPERCGSAPGNPASHLAGFGASVLGALWLSRRRQRPD